MREKPTKAQSKLLAEISRGQSVSGHAGYRVAKNLERMGLIKDGRATVSFNRILTFYKLTEARRTVLSTSEGKR